MSECRYCHEQIPAEGNAFRHVTGLCVPSRNEVESAIAQLEIDDEREKEALRNFWKREREQARRVTFRGVLKVAGFLCLMAAGWLFVVLWMSL